MPNDLLGRRQLTCSSLGISRCLPLHVSYNVSIIRNVSSPNYIDYRWSHKSFSDKGLSTDSLTYFELTINTFLLPFIPTLFLTTYLDILAKHLKPRTTVPALTTHQSSETHLCCGVGEFRGWSNPSQKKLFFQMYLSLFCDRQFSI